MTTPAQRLKTALEAPGLRLMPCCFDALSARLIEQAGFRVSLMSGFAVSATRLGMPDTGLISFAEMLDQLRNVCQAAPGLLVIGDGDTGYGNAMNVQRTVRDYARAGAAAVLIEDQVSPKRCGHTKGKQVVGRAEARMKIRAAVDAARSGSDDILILARTDARAVHGFDAALERCQDFVEEGADIIFMEAPHDAAEMAAFCAGFDRPAMANMVRGGQTPMLPPRELEALGFKLAAYPLTLMSAAIDAMRGALAAVADGQESHVVQADFEALKSLVGFPDYYEREQAYRAAE